jgi:hypothetical protein
MIAPIMMRAPKVASVHVPEPVTAMPADDVIDPLIPQAGSSILLHLEPRF